MALSLIVQPVLANQKMVAIASKKSVGKMSRCTAISWMGFYPIKTNTSEKALLIPNSMIANPVLRSVKPVSARNKFTPAFQEIDDLSYTHSIF